jgi:uncharacterized repeat protein (TIGR01451 family)
VKLSHHRKTMAFISFCIFCLFFMTAPQAFGSASAGYSEFYIPGDEAFMMQVLDDVGGNDQTGTFGYMHSVITVTVWTDNTTLYYDHWENGYGFDPADPGNTADETYSLPNSGDMKTFESDDIPTYNRFSVTPDIYKRNPVDTDPSPITSPAPYNNYFYDGRDRIYVAGGAATVSRAGWTESAGTLLAVAWEIYPVRPQLTTYILPFGEDLAPNYDDFDRVYTLIQATGDDTVIHVDLNKDDVYDDLDWNRDGTTVSGDNSLTLDAGEVFLLDQTSINGAATGLNTGTKIQASNTVQVQYIIGDQGTTYEIRGLSAFPRGFWDDEYYAPVCSPTNSVDDPTDIFLYNPHDSAITINYETKTNSGSFTIPAKTTRAYSDPVPNGTGSYVPADSSVYLRGSDVFWGISTIDTEGTANDWGYSLVPAFLLENEHYLGWAPGYYGTVAGDGNPYNDSGVFVAAAQDNITLYVDYEGDGYDDTPAGSGGDGDMSYSLSRLDTQYISDPYDGNMSNANIFATGPYVLAYGQNPDTAADAEPAIDVGYTSIPGNDFIDLVFTVDKSVTPQIIPTAAGEEADWTLVVNSYDFNIDAVSVADTLPPGWTYVNNSTTITMPNGSTKSDNPTGTTTLTWDDSILGSLAANQEITITFKAQTTQVFTDGVISRNDVKATGSRTVESVIQTFTTTDFAFVAHTDTSLAIEKTSNGVDPLSPGDTYTYTIDVENDGTNSVSVTDIAIYDSLPLGITYVASSSEVSFSPITFQDTFSSVSYANQADNTFGVTWETNWLETNDSGTAQSPSDGDIRILNNVSDYQLRVQGSAVEVARAADLSAYNEATLSFDYRRNSLEDGDDEVLCQVCQNSSTSGGSSTVAVDNATSGIMTSDDSDDIENFEHTTGSGSNRLMLVGISMRKENDYASSVVYGTGGAAQPLTQLTDVVVNNDQIQVFYLVDPEAGTKDVVVTLADNQKGAVVGIVTFTGVDQTTPLGTESYVYNNDKNSYNVTTSVTQLENGMVFDTIYGEEKDGTLDIAVDASQTQHWNLDEEQTEGCGSTKAGSVSGSGSVTMSWTLDEYQKWGIFAVPINPASGGTSSITCPGGWVTVDTFEGSANDGSYTSVSYDLNSVSILNGAANDADFALRFVSSSDMDDTDQVYFDNVKIDVGATTPLSAGDPPNFIDAGDGYDLGVGESLTLTFDVTVDDPLATGIDEIVNTAYVNAAEIPVSLSADATNIVNNPSAATGEVGDLVWLDSDGDGTKDTGEPGLSNVQVTLKDQYGKPLAVAYTDGTGHYRFTGISPGDDYYVEVTGGLPAGLEQSAPSGHSDDKTDAFNLSAGGVFLDADLGYTSPANTGTIGDFVWNDADSDGNQDSGELGLAGVTVLLYEDVDGDGVFEPGGDDGAAIDSVVTAADGSYLFAGVTASGTEDYFVYVDESQAALTGYSGTTSPATQVIDLDDGDARLSNDFGFQSSGSTYTYKDRVWFDADENEQDDSETGISGVTVNLLDSSRGVLATVTTAADGYFEFSGLQGSTFYYVEISDTAGKLTDYYGTTAESLAGELQISNLSGDIDNTVEPTEPSFGYSASGAIGDTVFNDVDGDEAQDAGELGLSGVTVELYSDGGTLGEIDGTDVVIATVTTDANGNYMFSGLADGDYIVSIETPPTDYDYTGTGAMADEDSVTDGAQVDVEITGGGSNLDIDFGFRILPVDQRSISGTLWNDTDNEGDFDETVYKANVTVELRDSGGDLVATTTTNGSGYYAFTGLPDGTYTVKITDENGVLSGWDTTYEETEGVLAGSYNGQESVTVNSSNASASINFGYYNPPVVTRAVIGEFNAFDDGGKVVVRWETLSENGTLGFYLQRLDEKTGKYKTVNKKLIPAFLFNASGGWYQVEDQSAKTDQSYTYRLEEVEILGTRNTYGPWEVYTGMLVSADSSDVEYSSVKSISGFERSPRQISDIGKARLASKMTSKLQNFVKKLSRKGNQAKITVAEDGLYYVSAENIAEVLDMKFWYVQWLIKKNGFSLQCQGEKVAVMPEADNNGLYFYGQSISTRYADENVYWLSTGKSSVMKTVKGSPNKSGAAPAWFTETIHAEEDHYGLTSIFNDPTVDFWMWDYAFPGYGKDDITVSVATPGAINSVDEKILISVGLQGATDVTAEADHHAMISLNGAIIGETIWDGLSSENVSFEVDSSVLNGGDNTVTITGIKEDGVLYNIFYLNEIEIAYPRSYYVIDNQLAAVNDTGNTTLAISGFTDANIFVFDISNPDQPKIISRTSIEADEDNLDHFRVNFKASTGQVKFFAVTLDNARSTTLVADQPSILKTRYNWGDYLVITSDEMVSAAQSLADYRATQGYVSMVVDIEDIYDEFSDGVVDAEAIREFLAYAYSNWRIPPQYVLLAGDGSYDYKDCMGFGAPVIQPLLVGTPDGLFITDNPYADITGNDGVPEIFLGRVPVVSEEELLGYIEKVKAYEAGGEWENRALFAADVPDGGADFPANSDTVADSFPPDFMLDRVYLDEMSLADGRQAFVESLNNGTAYVNFIGHGGINLIGNKRLFSTDDMGQLSNAGKTPVITAMTCAAGNFGFLGFDALNEVLVTKVNGGAVAMWSPSGFADNELSMMLCKAFYKAIFESGEMTLGEAIRQSQTAFLADSEYRYYLDLYNLLGDPALRVK